MTIESEQLQPLDLSLKPASSGAPTNNSGKPSNHYAGCVVSSFQPLAPGRGWAPTVKRPVKRDLSENQLRDIQASWTSAIHLVNNAPLRLESPPSTTGAVASQEGLSTGSPCTSPKQSTDNPPSSKRQKVSGTKIWWPPIIIMPESYTMHTVAWRPKNSAGKESGSNSEQPQPLDLSIKPVSSGASTSNSRNPLNQHMSCVVSSFHTLAPGRGWVPTVMRPVKRDLSENQLRDIQASWTSAIHLVNNAPLRLESPPCTARTGASQEELRTGSPCTSPKQSTDNPPSSKRQKVSGTKTWWPPIVSESYKMHTVAWCPENSAG